MHDATNHETTEPTLAHHDAWPLGLRIFALVTFAANLGAVFYLVT